MYNNGWMPCSSKMLFFKAIVILLHFFLTWVTIWPSGDSINSTHYFFPILLGFSRSLNSNDDTVKNDKLLFMECWMQDFNLQTYKVLLLSLYHYWALPDIWGRTHSLWCYAINLQFSQNVYGIVHGWHSSCLCRSIYTVPVDINSLHLPVTMAAFREQMQPR